MSKTHTQECDFNAAESGFPKCTCNGVALPEASPATKGVCNDERACANCYSGQGECLMEKPIPAAANTESEEG